MRLRACFLLLLCAFLTSRADAATPDGGVTDGAKLLLERQDEQETEAERQWHLDADALVLTHETVKHRLCAKKTRTQRKLAERYPLDFP